MKLPTIADIKKKLSFVELETSSPAREVVPGSVESLPPESYRGKRFRHGKTNSKNPKPRDTKFRARWFQLKEGAAFNPLLDYPRNMLCWCGTKVKAKKCCMPYLPRAVSQELADNIRTIWGELMLYRVTLPGAPRPPRTKADEDRERAFCKASGAKAKHE